MTLQGLLLQMKATYNTWVEFVQNKENPLDERWIALLSNFARENGLDRSDLDKFDFRKVLDDIDTCCGYLELDELETYLGDLKDNDIEYDEADLIAFKEWACANLCTRLHW